jgi:hypothetical protein
MGMGALLTPPQICSYKEFFFAMGPGGKKGFEKQGTV